MDTHLLIWTSSNSLRLSKVARSFIGNLENTLLFSVASILEMAIRHGLHRPDFEVDRKGASRKRCWTMNITSCQSSPPTSWLFRIYHPLHRDPFDRLLIAQATVEGITLLTSDDHVADGSTLFSREMNLALPKLGPSLRIDRDPPKLDGAVALAPLYATAANSIYGREERPVQLDDALYNAVRVSRAPGTL